MAPGVTKTYDRTRTPYRRVLAEPARRRLEAEHAAHGPVALRRALDAAVERLDRLREPTRGWAAAAVAG